MINIKQTALMIIPIVAIAMVIMAKQGRDKATALVQNAEGKVAVQTSEAEKALPRLVDLGATKCIPCKMMAPILEELKKAYAGQLQVDFIDVWENPDAGKEYGINLIPTQIFYDADGKERFRHEGFFAKEDILAKWKELGVSLSQTNSSSQ